MYPQMERDMSDSTTKASKEVKRLNEKLKRVIGNKLGVEKELANEKAKRADELKERLGIATEEVKNVCVCVCVQACLFVVVCVCV